MRWRQITLNESQAQYSNRCCFCEYGNWHLPPFYLICTKNTTHRTPTLTILMHEIRRTLQNDFQLYNSDHYLRIIKQHIDIIGFLYYYTTESSCLFETISYIIKDKNDLIILPILSIQTFAYHLTVIQSQ